MVPQEVGSGGLDPWYRRCVPGVSVSRHGKGGAHRATGGRVRSCAVALDRGYQRLSVVAFRKQENAMTDDGRVSGRAGERENYTPR